MRKTKKNRVASPTQSAEIRAEVRFPLSLDQIKDACREWIAREFAKNGYGPLHVRPEAILSGDVEFDMSANGDYAEDGQSLDGAIVLVLCSPVISTADPGDA